jgi:stage V sporulation protein S
MDPLTVHQNHQNHQNSQQHRSLAFFDADPDDTIIRVSGGTDAQAVASVIANFFFERPEVVIRAMGAGSVNQAVKAIAISRGYIATRGLDLICRPGFANVEGVEKDMIVTAMVFRLSLR